MCFFFFLTLQKLIKKKKVSVEYDRPPDGGGDYKKRNELCGYFGYVRSTLSNR